MNRNGGDSFIDPTPGSRCRYARSSHSNASSFSPRYAYPNAIWYAAPAESFSISSGARPPTPQAARRHRCRFVQPEQAEGRMGFELEHFHRLGRPPLVQVGQSEPEVRECTVRIELDCLFRLHLRLVQAIGKIARPRQSEVGSPAQWVEHGSAPDQRRRLHRPGREVSRAALLRAAPARLRVKLQRSSKRRVRALPIPVIQSADLSQRGVSLPRDPAPVAAPVPPPLAPCRSPR